MSASGLRRKTVTSITNYLCVAIIIVWSLAPVYWLVVSSITTTSELASVPPHWIPQQPTLERYTSILTAKTIAFRGSEIRSPASLFRRAMWNSTVVAGTTTIICLCLGSLTAYAFARLRFPLKGVLLSTAIGIQMLPPIALLVPLYWILKDMRLINTRTSLIMVNTSLLLVYVIWVMTGYFRSIPKELEDSARVDGCSRLSALFKIILPVSTPGLVATGLLTFLLAWDEFMFALTLTNSVEAKTITVAIGEFSTQYGIDYGMMTTGGVFAAIPPVVLALIFQRFITSGLTSGAVKG